MVWRSLDNALKIEEGKGREKAALDSGPEV